MKRLTAIVVLGLLAAGHSAATDASTCYTISDPDHRAMCLAKAHKDPGRCYSIQDPKVKSECRAEVGN